MKKRMLSVRLAALCLTAMLVGTSFTVYADDDVETATEEATEGEALEEGAEGDLEGQEVEGEDATIVMSGITASNGREIAEKFPDSLVPSGFHKTTVDYSGKSVDVAYMDSDYYGEVVLAYLANPDGSDGDFYLCDVNTAQMSDYVRIPNGEGKFIVVLNPGDNVVAPSGFTKATLNWHGKNVTAWALPSDKPADNSKDSKKKDKKDKEDKEEVDESSIMDVFMPMDVYALDITAGATDDEDSENLDENASDENASADEDASNDETADDSAKEEKMAEVDSEPEDGSRVEYASAKDFFLVYAIDQDGIVGFYLYDIVGETFQRYVQISNGEGAILTQYKNSAKLRLIIIVALAVLLVIAIIVIINLSLRGSSAPRRRYDDDDDDEDDDDDDEDDERSRMIRRVAKKEKNHIRQGRRELNYQMDVDDDDDDEDEEDDFEIEDYSAPVRRKSASAPVRRSARPVVEDEEDEEDDDIIPQQTQAPQRRVAEPAYEEPIRRKAASAGPKKGISIEPTNDFDLDDDFEFEFLDLK